MAILVEVFYIMSMGGPSKLLQQALPSQLTQAGQNSNQQQDPGSQQSNQSNNSKQNAQEIQCATNILGQVRMNQIMNGGSKPTSQEYAKIQNCFPSGFQF